MMTTPSSNPAVLDRLRFLVVFVLVAIRVLAVFVSSVFSCSCLDSSWVVGGGGGARISGTGPEKSFPVMRSSVFISTVIN